MSGTSRREQIESMLAAEPEDVFLRYSLAMELRKEENYDESLAHFQRLMKGDPPHVPSFFMAAKLLVHMHDVERARGMLREGIEQARLQGDKHAAAEMGELLAALETGSP